MMFTAIFPRRIAKYPRATISEILSRKNSSDRSRSKRKIKGDEDRCMKGGTINESTCNFYPHDGMNFENGRINI